MYANPARFLLVAYSSPKTQRFAVSAPLVLPVVIRGSLPRAGLVLNSAAAKEINWHIEHYTGELRLVC